MWGHPVLVNRFVGFPETKFKMCVEVIVLSVLCSFETSCFTLRQECYLKVLKAKFRDNINTQRS
jgi:hypothetical protein